MKLLISSDTSLLEQPVIIIVRECMWECVCACGNVCVHVCVSVCPHIYSQVSMTKNQCWAFLSIVPHLVFLGRVSDWSRDSHISQAGWSARPRDPLFLFSVLDHTSSQLHSAFYVLNSNSHAFKASALPSESSTQPMLNFILVFLVSLLLCLIYNLLVRLNHRFVCTQEHTAYRKGT